MCGLMSSRPDIDRQWYRIKPVSQCIKGTSIICFKTPLSITYNNKLEQESKFSIKDLLQKVEQETRKLNAIIKLTEKNHCGYNEKDLLEVDPTIKLYEFPLRSKEIPSREILNKIHDIIYIYEQNQEIIGIHCKHGLNRTGYIVCSYLILRKKMNYQEAVECFNLYRGAIFKKKVYLKKLSKFQNNQPEL